VRKRYVGEFPVSVAEIAIDMATPAISLDFMQQLGEQNNGSGLSWALTSLSSRRSVDNGSARPT